MDTDINAPSPDKVDKAKAALAGLSHSDASRVFDYCLTQAQEELNTALDADMREVDRFKANIRIELLRELAGLVSPLREMTVTIPNNS